MKHWLRHGAGVPGYLGFAIGRTIWWDALVGYRDRVLDRQVASRHITDKYLAAIEVYASEAGAS